MSILTTLIVATLAKEIVALGLGINKDTTLELGVIMVVAGAIAIVSSDAIKSVGSYAVAGAGMVSILAIIAIVMQRLRKRSIKREPINEVAETTIAALFGLISAGGIGLLFRSVIVKAVVTLLCTIRHPVKAFFHIPKNWKNQIAVNDLYYTPELLPDIRKKIVSLDYQVS